MNGISTLALLLFCAAAPILRADTLHDTLKQKGNVELGIRGPDGRAPESDVFQKTENQKLLSTAACSGLAPDVKAYCGPKGTIRLRLEALRLIRQKNGAVKVALRTNLGTFVAEPGVAARTLFSGKDVAVRFPSTRRSWGSAFEISARGNLVLRRDGAGFAIPSIRGILEVTGRLLGYTRSARDEATMKRLTARPAP